MTKMTKTQKKQLSTQHEHEVHLWIISI